MIFVARNSREVVVARIRGFEQRVMVFAYNMINQRAQLMLESSENQDLGLHVLVTVSVGSVLSIVPLHLSSWVAYIPGMRNMSSQGGQLKALSPTNLQQDTAVSGSADGKTGLIAWSTGSPS